MDFDAEDERRKRKNHERHNEYSQERDSTKDHASEESDQDRAQRPVPDLQRLKWRGNGPVRIAMMEGMQQTRGNRAVQRYVGAMGAPTPYMDRSWDQAGQASTMDNPFDGILGPKSGSGGGIGGVGKIGNSIVGGIAAALGNFTPRDPMVEQMWSTSVIQPMNLASEQLKNVQGSETEKIAELKDIRENLKSALLVIRELKNMLEENGVDPEMVARLKAANNTLIAINAGISTHIPEKEDDSASRTMLEMYLDETKELGDALIENAPAYNPVTYKPIGPPRPAADNPMATKMWHMTVVGPLEKAIKRLKGHPNKAHLAEALEDISRAKNTIDSNMIIYWSNPILGARVDKVGKFLLSVMRRIQDKLGQEVSLEDLSSELKMTAIPMEYYAEALSRASAQIAANAQKKKDDDGADDTK